jgi:hypothetical protein
MFVQLKNSVRYVVIRPCLRDKCLCYAQMKRKSKDAIVVERQWHEEYLRCYKYSNKPNRDIFLL